MLESLRQLRYPREFRIGPLPPPTEALDTLERIAASLESLVCTPEGGSQREVDKLLAQVATELWRLRRKLELLDKTQPPAELRAILRPFQSAWDSIIQSGVEIDDHADEPYDGGMAVEVLTFQPCPELTRERVIETLRPTIYRNGQVIQLGQVIVGQPAKETR
ncbi:MAG: hypothetical protein Q8P22_13600 [Chloroflexota bacterium]|nr:hypothetical protein [Chloroflexota bacterium]